MTYVDVQNVDSDLKRLRSGVERVHEEFRRYRWREPLQEAVPDNVVPLTIVTAPAFNVPIVQDIAAFSRQVPSGGSQDDNLEMLSSQWFDDKSLFYVRRDTMGFTIPAGSIAIVEAAPSSPADHELVIARRGMQTFARRLLRPRNGEGYLPEIVLFDGSGPLRDYTASEDEWVLFPPSWIRSFTRLRDLKREIGRAELTIPAFEIVGGDQS